MESNYQTDLDKAHARLRELLDQREQLQITIAKQRLRIAALMSLAEQNEEIDQVVGMTLGGLADACRTALRSAAFDSLTPMQVKDRLAQLGFSVEHYRNVMAAIHTTLKRLADTGEVVSMRRGDETTYQWRKVLY
jgi:predicted RNA-binding protein YlqC (UPF0109 family)